MPAPSAATFSRLADLIAIPDAAARPRKPITEVFTGKELATVPVGTAADAVSAIARARVAQKAWASRPASERAEIVHRYRDLVLAHRDELMDMAQAETGKSRSAAQEEVLDIAMTARHYARVAAKLLAPKRVTGMLPVLTKTTVRYQPKGIVGIIAPWNYPMTLAVSDAIPALLAGNGVVLKPDSQTPYCALAVVELLYKAGLPRDLFAVVPGPGSVVGTAIVENTDYVMFTGSTATGQLITKFGQWKPFIVAGSVLLVIGFFLLGSIDHETSLWTVGIFITIVGLGTGMLMQNLVLAVQNTVSVHNVGAASSTVAFFRTFGGAIGVSVLGSLLATRVAEKSASGLAQLGVDTSGSSGGSSLDLGSLPAPVAAVIRTAYGDATGRIFLVAGFVAIITLIAVVLIPNRPLRKTIDFAQEPIDGEEVAEIPSFGATREYLAPEIEANGRHEASAGSAPFAGLSTDARDRLLTLLLPEPNDTLAALDEAEAIRAQVLALQQELDAKMLDFDAVCERLRRLGLSEYQIARVLGDNHVPDSHNYAHSGLNGQSVN